MKRARTRSLACVADDLRAYARGKYKDDSVLEEAADVIEELRGALLRAMHAKSNLEVCAIAFEALTGEKMEQERE